MEQIILLQNLPNMESVTSPGAISLEWGIATLILLLIGAVGLIIALLQYVVKTIINHVNEQLSTFTKSIEGLTKELKETNLELARMVQASLLVKHDVDELKDRVTEVEVAADELKDRVTIVETKCTVRATRKTQNVKHS